MKKAKHPAVLLIVLATLSLASYIYLNSQEVETQVENRTMQVEEMDKEDIEKSKKFIIPDVELIKRVIQNGKRLLPAS